MTTPFALSPDRIDELADRHGTPLLILSPAVAVNQYRAVTEALPGVRPHYALKALSHPALLTALRDAGADFDICSPGEIDLVRQLDIAPERCIHTHPIKRPGDIRACVEFGCRTMVFDNIDELAKLEPYKEHVDLLLRLSFRSKEAVVDLSYKFGCAPDQALELLRTARDRGFSLAGLCFHVGSQATYAYKYLEAISFCRQICNLAALDGIDLAVIDIGGGFPVPYTEQVAPIHEFCRPIAETLERDFPDSRLLCEPGRFIAAPAATLVTAVMGRSERSGSMWYYLDEGVYGSYSGKVFDHCNYLVSPLRVLRGDDGLRRPSILAGPSCDSFDVIYEGLMLPELEPGDRLVSPMMGAYTAASACAFNLFPPAAIVVVDDSDEAGTMGS